MDMANKDAILNPCPPFYRGEEVSADAIDSDYFVGYQFKKYLLEIQQAIMFYCLSAGRGRLDGEGWMGKINVDGTEI